MFLEKNTEHCEMLYSILWEQNKKNKKGKSSCKEKITCKVKKCLYCKREHGMTLSQKWNTKRKLLEKKREDTNYREHQLYEFIKKYWEIEKKQPLDENWHIKAICDALEKVYTGETKRLYNQYATKKSKDRDCIKSVSCMVFMTRAKSKVYPNILFCLIST